MKTMLPLVYHTICDKLVWVILLPLTLLPLTVFPQALFAQVAFHGIVLDKDSRDPIVGVTIFVVELKQEMYSDELGTFQLSLQPGIYEFLLIYPGFKKLKAKTKIFSNEPEPVRFLLEPDQSYVPTEAQVTAEKIKHTVSRTTLTQEEMKTIPAGAGDIIRQFIGTIPGVVIPSGGFGAANFVVRGGEPEDNVIYFDNIKIRNVFHFGGFVSIFNAESINNIDFYAGGFPAGLGHYVGSVMDIKSTRRAKKKPSGKFNVNMITSDFLFQTPIGEHVYLMMSARRSYFDLIVPYFAPIQLDTWPFFWDVYGKLCIDPNENNKIDLFGIASLDRIEANVDADAADQDILVGDSKFDNIFYAGGFNWKLVPGKKWFNEMTLGWLRYDLLVQIGKDVVTGEPYHLSLERNEFTLRNSTNILLLDNLELVFGPYLTYSYIPFDLVAPRIPLDGTPIETIDDLGPTQHVHDLYQSLEVDGFTKVSWTLGNVKLIFGPEVNWLNLNHQFNISPRLSTEWTFLPTWKLLGAFGLYYQSPRDVELQGFSNLKDKYAFHYIAGVSKEITETTHIKMEGYFKQIHNSVEFDRTDIVRDPATNEITGIENVYSNSKKAYAYGLEVFIKQDLWKGFYGWLSYTLSQAKYRGRHDPDYRLSEFDQTHILSIIFSYRMAHWLRVSGKFRLNSGQPFTSIIGRNRISPQTTPEPEYEAIYNPEPYSERYPIQHQLDLRFDFIFKAFGGNMALYIELINAYWAQNVTNYGYGDNYSRYDNPTESYGLPILPYLGVEFEF